MNAVVVFAILMVGLYFWAGGQIFSFSATLIFGMLFLWLVFPALWKYRRGPAASTGVFSSDFVTAVIRFPIALGFLVYGSLALCGFLVIPAAPLAAFGMWTGTKAMIALRKADETRSGDS